MRSSKIVKNASWIIACKIVQALLSIVVTMLSARFWDPSGYGLINSAAQIWTTAIFLCYFLLRNNTCSKGKIFLYYCIILYLLLMCFLSECRTALIGISVVTLLNIIFISKHKIVLLLGVLIAVLVVFRIPAVYKFAEKALGLSKMEQGLDNFSSGRIGLHKEALQTFYDSPLIGTGNYYVDCSYNFYFS